MNNSAIAEEIANLIIDKSFLGNEWFVFVVLLIISLFAIVSAWAGAFFSTKGRNKAIRSDFNKALKNIEKNTNIIEEIKNQFNEKYWVKQQVWETKRESYDELIDSFYKANKYLDLQVEYESEYFDAHVVMQHTADLGYGEESTKSHNLHVDKIRKDFTNKFESEEASNKRKEIRAEVKRRLKTIEQTIETRSIYLDAEIEDIKNPLKEIIKGIFEHKIIQGDHEDFDSLIERSIGHSMKIQEELVGLITAVKTTAIKDLKL